LSTAFVLSGGASLGAVQVGMLKALAEAGVRPDLLVGTSVGAVNAAWLAGHPEPERVDELVRLWRSIRTRDVFPVNPRTAMRGLLGRGNHLVEPDGLRELLRRHLGFERLERAATPVHVVATEVLTGQSRLLSRGPAVDAILASCAIPCVYPPVAIAGRQYVDGGVSDNAPVSHAVSLGARTVYVLSTGYACALSRPPSNLLAMALHALTLLLQGQLIADVERNGAAADIRVLPPLCPLGVSPADFGHTDELIARAEQATRSWLRAAGARGGPELLAFHGRHRSTRTSSTESIRR
jgi:NTE family protein